MLLGADAPQKAVTQDQARFGILSRWAALLAFVQILVGGFVGSSGASLVCPSFPFCYGTSLGTVGPQHLQMFHRFVGLLLFVFAIFLAVKARKIEGLAAKEKGHVFGAAGMILLQILIGVGNIHMGIPPAMTILHLIFAEGIFFVYVSLAKELTPNSQLLLAQPGRSVSGGPENLHAAMH